jgi:hypothetical protein
MCELCEAMKDKVECPSCNQKGTRVAPNYVDRKLIYKPFIQGEYRECENKECDVRFFSNHNAYFKTDTNQ